jgi:tetratricopeptide (TPR) repeat protein
MRLATINTAALVVLAAVSSARDFSLFAGEPDGILPHYHGFDVAKRHWNGWRDRGVGGHLGFSRHRSIGCNVWGGSPYGSFAYSSGTFPLVCDYPPTAYILPPLILPAEQLYGPQALDRFLGINRNAVNPLVQQQAWPQPQLLAGPLNLGGGPMAGGNGVGQPGGAIQPGGAAQPGAAQPGAAQPDVLVLEKPDVRESNQAARERAGRFLQFGDALFAQQRYHEALQRYKSAAEAAPDLAEPYFRQAQALIATNRIDLAANAVKRALALDNDVTRNGFHLDDLYGDAQIAKTAHLDGLAQAALNRPGDPDPLLVLGLFLYYDGQQERSRQFFTRAAELLGANSAYARLYLNQMAAEQPVGIDL